MTAKALNDNVLFWNRFSKKYDRFITRFTPEYSRLISRIVQEIGSADRVLEVAAGTGVISLELAAVAKRVDAVDLSPNMVEIGSEKAKSRGLKNLFFQAQSAYGLEFANESFNAVVCANALHVMESPGLALNEIRRVLVPDGLLIAPTYCHGQSFRARWASRFMSLSGFRTFYRFRIVELKYLVEKSGFAVIGEEIIPRVIPLFYIVGRKK